MTEILADHTELFKQFSDNESFRRWLSEMVFRHHGRRSGHCRWWGSKRGGLIDERHIARNNHVVLRDVGHALPRQHLAPTGSRSPARPGWAGCPHRRSSPD